MKHMNRTFAAVALSLGLASLLTAQKDPPNPIEPEAIEALKKMGGFLRGLKTFQVRAEIARETVLDNGQKVQFAHTSTIVARSPDKLYAEVEGDDRSRTLTYNGKTFTLFARRAGYYATVDAPPTIGQLIDATDKYEIDIPLVDLFLFGGPRASTDQITVADNIGNGQVGGVSCTHYIYRQPGLDWQVWIQRGDSPLPRKLVITTMTDDARPQYSAVIDWNLAPSYSEDTFNFVPPPGANRVVFAADAKK